MPDQHDLSKYHWSNGLITALYTRKPKMSFYTPTYAVAVRNMFFLNYFV